MSQLSLIRAGSSTASIFTPKKITGLVSWWDASDPATLYQTSGGSLATADGDPVGEWRDKSGNGYHWAQASGTNKPALKTNIKNSRSVVRLDGVNDYMQVASSVGTFKFLHSTDSTIFAVFNCSSLAATRMLLDNCGGASANIGHALYVMTTGSNISLITRGIAGQPPSSNASSASYIAAGSWYALSVISKPGDATAANRSTIYKNSGSYFANNANTFAVSTSNSTYSLTLGADGTGAVPFIGDFAEILIYNSALSAGNRASVESYLNKKWNIY